MMSASQGCCTGAWSGRRRSPRSQPISTKTQSRISPAFVRVVQEGSFVGVVATSEWAAINAAKALKVTWSQPSTKMPASSEEIFSILKDTKSLRDQVPVNKGNPESALAQASKKYEATYRWPFQLHGMIGPSCAVADVGKDSA